MAELRTPPPVIPKRRTVKIGGTTVAFRDSLQQEIEAQTLEDVQYALYEYTVEETDKQVRLGNEPSRVVVDNREGKSLKYAKYKTEVEFGEIISNTILKEIVRSVVKAARKAANRDSHLSKWNEQSRRRMVSATGWQWWFSPADKKQPTVRVNPYRLKGLPIGSRLILAPRFPDYEWENMMYIWSKMGLRRSPKIIGKGDKSGRQRTFREPGFMAESIARLKRNRLAKNFTIYAAFSTRLEPPGSRARKQGAPIIVFKVLRKQRAYRRFK